MLIDYILFWLALAVMLSPLVLYALSWFSPRSAEKESQSDK